MMDFGVHLPLMDFGGNPFTLDHLITYAETSQKLGFTALAANDHLVYSRPWLDGPTTLAAVLSHSGQMDLANELEQIEIFMRQVVPLIEGRIET